jgi:hypothetical protein
VTAYVPNGDWTDSITGIQVVPLEGGGAPVTIPTTATVNSCAANSNTGQVVCVGNDTTVYIINGKTITATLASSADTFAGFSGGICQNCGVAIDCDSNTAWISIGTIKAPRQSGWQKLHVKLKLHGSPFLPDHEVAENFALDTGRNWILSPNQGGVFDILKIGSGGTLTEYANVVGGVLESGAEDLSTGIALATIGGTAQIFIADLTQATFTSTPPRTWSAPSQIVTFPEFSTFTRGTAGIAVAQSSHLAVVTGENGGNAFGVLRLPDTSGSGTPAFEDYAAAVLPNTPDGLVFQQGRDPHTVSAYTSPNTDRAYGVLVDGWPNVPPAYLAVVDLEALLAAPRVAGTHQVSPAFDLIANGVVRYVKVN